MNFESLVLLCFGSMRWMGEHKMCWLIEWGEMIIAIRLNRHCSSMLKKIVWWIFDVDLSGNGMKWARIDRKQRIVWNSNWLNSIWKAWMAIHYFPHPDSNDHNSNSPKSKIRTLNRTLRTSLFSNQLHRQRVYRKAFRRYTQSFGPISIVTST